MKEKKTVGIHQSAGVRETRKLGIALAGRLKKGSVVGFTGELGSGKTTMIKAMVRHLTGGEATSPSFVIVNEYPGRTPVYHFDFYRLSGDPELETFGWDDYITNGILLVEWADRCPDALPRDAITVSIEVESERSRVITISNLKKRR